MGIADAGLAVEVGVDDIAPLTGMLLLVGKAGFQAGVHGGVQVGLQRYDLVVEPRGVLGTLKVGVIDVLQNRLPLLST